MRFLTLFVAVAFAAQADAGPIRNLISRLRGPAPSCQCNPCHCQSCKGGCEGPVSRPPLVKFTEQVEVLGRPIGYTVQTRPPFVRVQAGGCVNGQCPLK